MPLPKEKSKVSEKLGDYKILVYGAAKIGKCLAGTSWLVDPITKRIHTIKEVIEEKKSVYSLNHAGNIIEINFTNFSQNAPEQLYLLKTQTGRHIEVTSEHPMLTEKGWKPLKDLDKDTDRVCVVVDYCNQFGSTRTEDANLKVLAYLIADGNLTNSCVSFTKHEDVIRQDFIAAAELSGDICVEYCEDTAVRVKKSSTKGRSNLKEYIFQEGLEGKKAKDKFIPKFIFGLEKSKLALFLNRLFTCDGSPETSGRISYSSTSIHMVEQVQHLLSRFGINCVITDKYLEGELYGAELLISQRDDILKFCTQIGMFGSKADRLEKVLDKAENRESKHTQIKRFNHLIFDRIESITESKVDNTYDIEIPGLHNFIANDFVVHNSTFASQFPDAIFLATEAGLNSLEVYQAPVPSWEKMLELCKDLASGKHNFKTVVIDTVDNAYKLCSEFMCEKLKISHESDAKWGKGFSMVNSEFQRVITRLSHLPYGLIMISHSKEKEIETKTGTKVRKIIPTIPNGGREIILGMVDITLYADIMPIKDGEGKKVIGSRRVFRTKPTTSYEAGDRTKRLPEILDLDYDKFLEAFKAGKSTSSEVSLDE